MKVLSQGVSRYTDAVTAAPGLLHYYRFERTRRLRASPTARASAPARSTDANLGVPGAINGDSDTAVELRRRRRPASRARRALRRDPDEPLRARRAITVEFWLKWNAYGNNDALAMEFTPNYNENAGGFIVDPERRRVWRHLRRRHRRRGGRATASSSPVRAPACGTTTRSCSTRRAPAATEITPYVDGQPVSYQKEGSGTGAGAFANSTLYLMSRDGELAVRQRLAARTWRSTAAN